eukprot:4524852-Alexandrium_andersonii.AAC.1
MMKAARGVFGNRDKLPKKPWIRQPTLDQLELRARLVQDGKYADADVLNKGIKKLARGDRKAWVQQGLEDRFWDPVRILSRPKARRVVSLKSEGFRSTAAE